MGRHGVLRNLDETRELSGRDAFRLASDQEPEGLEPRRLGERRQSSDDLNLIHISRMPDISIGAKRNVIGSEELRARFARMGRDAIQVFPRGGRIVTSGLQ